MIKVKIYELDKHRNETTFRPYIMAQNVLREIGIEFTNGDSYDFAWVGQASFMNKKVSLQQSTEDGLEFLSKITGDYMLFDGQDATTLLGSYDVFKESNALLLLKNSLLKDRELYKQGWNTGRIYWGPGNYSCKDFDIYSEKIQLSGTNWLSAIPKPNWFNNTRKIRDVGAVFGLYPEDAENMEHECNQVPFYNKHRKQCLDVVNKLDGLTMSTGIPKQMSMQEYLNTMALNKIILSPHGYGEMNPRDIEAISYGCIVIKPDMSYIDTNPNWYENDKTYIACKNDFSDLEEKIHYVLDNFDELQNTMIPYARRQFTKLYQPENLAIYLHSMFKNLKGIEPE